VDAVELSSSGWHIRPDAVDPTLTPGVAR
jgi:hypothetical protein